MPCTIAPSRATPARECISSLSLHGVDHTIVVLQQSSGNQTKVHAYYYNAHDGRVVPVHPSVDTVAPCKEC
eukprot:1374262-Pyramimonas_sp.AAC.1